MSASPSRGARIPFSGTRRANKTSMGSERTEAAHGRGQPQAGAERLSPREQFAGPPLAVVGMGCRLPGADNLDDYWNLIRQQRTGIGELPPERLDRELYFQP